MFVMPFSPIRWNSALVAVFNIEWYSRVEHSAVISVSWPDHLMLQTAARTEFHLIGENGMTNI
jgi:hypothetical protein